MEPVTGYRTQSLDTSVQAERFLLDRMRELPSWRRAEMVAEMVQYVHEVSLVGLRQRHPDADRLELERRAAALRLGWEYGPELTLELAVAEAPLRIEAWDIALELAAALAESRIPYAVSGSLASGTHGEPRSTRDVDFAALVRADQVPELVRRLEHGFQVNRAEVEEAVVRRRSFNVFHRSTYFKVDVFVCASTGFEADVVRRGRPTQVKESGETAIVATPEDVVLHKLSWYRLGNGVSDQQWRDVLGVLKTRAGDLDLDLLDRVAAELALTDLLARALRESGVR